MAKTPIKPEEDYFDMECGDYGSNVDNYQGFVKGMKAVALELYDASVGKIVRFLRGKPSKLETEIR